MRLTEREAAAMGITSPRRNKYKNKKVEIDGNGFDSKKEAKYYADLVMKKKAGIILKFELQPEFVLQEGYRTKEGKKIREIKYKADFKVWYKNGKIEIVDTKGFKTKDYIIKKKMLLFRYPDITFIEV